MRPIHLALLALVALPAPAAARAWKGIDPGATTLAEVTARFGEPTARTKRGGRTVLAYHGEQALEGTKQVQFHLDARGVVAEITVFVGAELDAESIEGMYGKPPRRTFVEDTFRKVWLYPAAGVTVYFDKDGNVEALLYGPGKKGQARPSADPAPASESQAAAAGQR
jgi:hypothetical protein